MRDSREIMVRIFNSGSCWDYTKNAQRNENEVGICDVSNTPMLFLTAICSSLMSLYRTGISHPAKGITSPCFTCQS